jgi:flagellum-specific ATP synthase
VAGAVVPPQQMADAREVRRLMGALRDVRELIEIGAYQTGTDPLVDRARRLVPDIDAFLRQSTADSTPLPEAWARLHAIITAA